MDATREQWESGIKFAQHARKMLGYLAQAIESGEPGGSIEQRDAIEVLLYAQDVMKQHAGNLEHVGVVYDAMVNSPLADPNE